MNKSSLSGRIHRYPNAGVVAGVCFGVARYLGIDPIWTRLAAVFAVATLPMVAVAAYIAAVFLLPRR